MFLDAFLAHAALMSALPQRRRLSHLPPDWVSRTSLFFITFCAKLRGRNQLCLPEVGAALLASAEFYHERERWFMKLFLLMPDHIHALLAFPKEQSMPEVMQQ